MPSPASPASPGLSFQAIVEQSIAGVYVLQDECFVYCNDTWAGFFGMSREEYVGLSLRDVVPPDFIDTSLSMYRRRVSGEIPSVRYVTPAMHRDGHRIYLEVHGTRMEYAGRMAVVGVGIDVTERVQRDEELRQARNDLQELAAHINRDRELQRAQFARELHDVLGGLLASIKMDAKRIARRVQDPELQEITAGLMEVAQEAITTVRDMSEELRPSGLDHLGLPETIRRELERFEARYEITCSFQASGPENALANDRATSIYRIFQEGMNNVGKHAGARKVAVWLAQGDTELRLEIQDDGSGLPGGGHRVDARGILGMKERARELGGSIDIRALPAGGTLLRLLVPVGLDDRQGDTP
ncbi:MAG: PAS domain-containing sensor histidine kinase [Aquabacterium sp.]|nr:MAG: PAS domain-containing sensor histidine kinase [Aquabacterium sp.]